MREELLRDLFPVVELRSWLCRLASGTGGGTLFCVGVSAVSAVFPIPLPLPSDIDAES